MPRVYVVEDDQRIRESIVASFTDLGHQVTGAGRAMDALREIVEWGPDVVVLDLGLPDLDGGDLLKMLRGLSSVPVVVATARDDDAEIVRLLDAGADDYVVKPYTSEILDARIRAVLRRVGVAGDERRLRVGELSIDLAAREVTLAGQELELSRKEFDLLALLASRVGEVVSRQELLADVWRQPYGGADKTIDVHLSWLRRKLGESAAEPRYLHTVRGVGVKLVEPS